MLEQVSIRLRQWDTWKKRRLPASRTDELGETSVDATLPEGAGPVAQRQSEGDEGAPPRRHSGGCAGIAVGGRRSGHLDETSPLDDLSSPRDNERVLPHVTVPLALHTGTRSRKMRAPIRGLRASRMTRSTGRPRRSEIEFSSSRNRRRLGASSKVTRTSRSPGCSPLRTYEPKRPMFCTR